MPGFIGQFGIQAGFAGFRLGVQTAQNINLDRGCRFKLIMRRSKVNSGCGIMVLLLFWQRYRFSLKKRTALP